MTSTQRKALAVAVDAERCRRSLAHFIKRAWKVVEPDTVLHWNWHMQAVADHIQALYEELARKRANPSRRMRVQNLLVNIPPRSAKTLMTQVFGVAWAWARWPDLEIRCLAAADEVIKDASISCRDLMNDSWYVERFTRGYKCVRGKNLQISVEPSKRPDEIAWSIIGSADKEYRNTVGGKRKGQVWGSKITGTDSHVQIYDDPHDAEEANSDSKRKYVCKRYRLSIRNRVKPGAHCRFLIMQRLHEADVSCDFLDQPLVDHVKIPQLFDPKTRADKTKLLGWYDPRVEPDEKMFPELFDDAYIAGEKKSLKAYGFAGQHQQEPAPADGGMFKRVWWQWYTCDRWTPAPRPDKCNNNEPRRLPDRFNSTMLSIDANLKKTEEGSRASLIVLGFLRPDVYVLDNITRSMEYPELMASIQILRERFPRLTRILIEEAANGYAAIARLKKDTPGVIGIKALGGKESRAFGLQAWVEGGNVWLPEGAHWVDGFVHEHGVFPRGQWDDQIDSMSQAVAHRISDPNVNRVRMMSRR